MNIIVAAFFYWYGVIWFLNAGRSWGREKSIGMVIKIFLGIVFTLLALWYALKPALS